MADKSTITNGFIPNIFYRRCFSDHILTDAMTINRVTVSFTANQSVSSAYAALHKAQILSAPVFDEEAEPGATFLGVFAAIDLVQLLYPYLTANKALPDLTKLCLSEALVTLNKSTSFAEAEDQLSKVVPVLLGHEKRVMVRKSTSLVPKAHGLTSQNAGILTQSDIVRYLLEALEQSNVTYDLSALCGFSLRGMSYKPKSLFVALPSNSVRDALHMLGEHNVSVLGVVDADGALIGDFSAQGLGSLEPMSLEKTLEMPINRFLACVTSEQEPGDEEEAGHPPDDANDDGDEKKNDDEECVVLKKAVVVTRTLDDSFEEILYAMSNVQSHHVWICRSGSHTPVTLVTMTDVLRTLCTFQSPKRLSPFVFDLPGTVTVVLRSLKLRDKHTKISIVATRKPRPKRRKKGEDVPGTELFRTKEHFNSDNHGRYTFDAKSNTFSFVLQQENVVANSDVTFSVKAHRMLFSDVDLGKMTLRVNWIAMAFGTDNYQRVHTVKKFPLKGGKYGSATLELALHYTPIHPDKAALTRKKSKYVVESTSTLEMLSNEINERIQSSLVDTELKERQAEVLEQAKKQADISSSDSQSNWWLNTPASPEVIAQDAKVIGASANSPMTIVSPELLLGNKWDAANLTLLKEMNVVRVINVTPDVPNYFSDEGIEYMRLQFSDEGGEDLFNALQDAFEFIDETKGSENTTLLHCFLGISRSAFIATAYLMQRENSDGLLRTAFESVHTKRPVAVPNYGFLRQLQEFEETLHIKSGSKVPYKPSYTEAELKEIAAYHPGERFLVGVDNPEFTQQAKDVQRKQIEHMRSSRALSSDSSSKHSPIV